MGKKDAWFWLAAPLLGTNLASAAEFHCARPACRTGIPTRDYRYRERSRSDTALSGTGTPLALATTVALTQTPTAALDAAVPETKARVFSLSRASLAVDHCRITQVAVLLEESGIWTLSLKAEQNPGVPPNGIVLSGDAREGPDQQFTLHLKRNQFVVRVRAYGNFPLAEELRDDSPGKPVMFSLEPRAFWVQRGEPYNLVERAYCPALKAYYPNVERLEVEFYYYQ
ncbi:MAG: hypothetical protein U0836_17605 [Pirellulales bacterium]